MVNRTLDVAVIGAGSWATRHHLPALLGDPSARLIAIVDQDAARAAAVAREHEVEASFSDVRDLLAAHVPDVAVVATPHHTHAPITAALLDAGVHVFVEKPLTIDPAEARALVRQAAALGLHLSVGYTYHFTPAAQRVRAWVRERLGELVQVTAEFSSYAGELYATAAPTDATSSYSAASGSGQATTQLTHALAAIQFATGDHVVEVAAMTRGHGLPVDVDDAVTFRLRSGAIGSAVSTGLLPRGVPLRHRVVYLGRDGVIEHDLIGGTATLRGGDGASLTVAPLHTDPAYPAGEPVRAFLRLVREGKADPDDARLAAHVVAVVDAVLTSARDRRFVLIDPEDDPDPDPDRDEVRG